ncbi:GDSL-type esterase/lipase family protein [Paenibacillus cremeus]|uniref:Lipase n=1 Tax=Paenibacillus cremeus TaxID=2163881 RepID=A0A559KHQ2_9BACL|nr:GDSL-type esterase/lipase family protein [Paenibacillus cremeus]TVY11667.1 lipase [Paenibacillus cremeus]
MITTRWLWRTVGLVALLSTLLCIFGFAYAVNQIMYPKPVVSEEPGAPQTAPQTQDKPKQDAWNAKDKIQIVALGDSLTAGTGDLTGKGYVGQVRDKLEKQLGKPVYVFNNFAIPGYRTADMLKDWDTKKDIDKSISEADLILLTIGGNDLFDGGADIFNTQNGEGFNPKAAAERSPEALKRLGQIFDRIAKVNPNAKIMYVGLYYPFLDLDKDRTGAPIVQQWNTSAFELANRYPNITVVPTYDLFELNLTKYIYSDHFHPNQNGYERIAQRIADILK